MDDNYYPYMMPEGSCNVLHAVNFADAMDYLGETQGVLFCVINVNDEYRLWDVNDKEAERIFCKYYNAITGYVM